MAPTLKARVRAALAAVDGAAEGEGVFDTDQPAFFVNGRLVAEFADNNALGIRLTRAVIREHRPSLTGDPRVDPIKSSSDWISVRFRRAADVDWVAGLVALAVPHYLPPPRQAVKPPPTGSTLERLRRFH